MATLALARLATVGQSSLATAWSASSSKLSMCRCIRSLAMMEEQYVGGGGFSTNLGHGVYSLESP